MKLLVAFATTIICISGASGQSLRATPGDNSHYVEGVSRYIWMPDGDGVPQLVDLREDISQQMLEFKEHGAQNEYLLYTRKNPKHPQILKNGNTNSIWDSNYSANRSLNVIAHGWTNHGGSPVNIVIKDALLKNADVNVIVLDWRKASHLTYTHSVKAVPSVGEHLGTFLTWLINTAGGDWNNVHLIGHSLGAHVVGNAGRAAGSRASRITGLDAAGPQWNNNRYALNVHDGQYVENIHTDAGLLGILKPIGNADFYPNGGTNSQPGCLTSVCSHMRSFKLFASSVLTNHFIGKLCTDVKQAMENECTGSEFRMGNNIMSKRGSGIYSLSTGNSWPY